jgi:hypothetical protein
MPNLSAQFSPDIDRLGHSIADRDDALIMFVRDVAKVCRGEIHPTRVKSFLTETMQAAYLIAKPDVGG